MKEPREKVLYVEGEPREAILRGVEIAPASWDEPEGLYIERWLDVALRFEVIRSAWSTEWYYDRWPSKDLEVVFGDQESQTLRIPEAFPLGARFQVVVYEFGGVAEIISRVDNPSSAQAGQRKELAVAEEDAINADEVEEANEGGEVK